MDKVDQERYLITDQTFARCKIIRHTRSFAPFVACVRTNGLRLNNKPDKGRRGLEHAQLAHEEVECRVALNKWNDLPLLYVSPSNVDHIIVELKLEHSALQFLGGVTFPQYGDRLIEGLQ